MFKKTKVTLAAVITVFSFVSIGTAGHSEKEIKLSKPKMRSAGTYIEPKNKDFYEMLSSEDEESKIHYKVNEINKDTDELPGGNDPVYTKPIPISDSGIVIKAVSIKEGYTDSEVAERYYIHSFSLPTQPVHGIKTKRLKKGMKKISGKLKHYRTKANRYIKLTVDRKNEASKTYKTKVVNNKWSVKLLSALKKRDRVHIRAYTKDNIVEFKKEKGKHLKKNTMSVIKYSAGEWFPVKITVK